MPNSWIDKSVKCPFYKETHQRTVVCEGLYATGTSAVFTFSSRGMRLEYQRAFCCGDYRRCVWAGVMIERYG